MTQAAEAAGLAIRNVTSDDEASVRELVTAAFPSDMEARLVHTLRHCGALVLEQVAVDADGRIVGHIAYSRVTPAAIGPGQGMQVVCLAPVSVWPDLQKTGIGSALIKASGKPEGSGRRPCSGARPTVLLSALRFRSRAGTQGARALCGRCLHGACADGSRIAGPANRGGLRHTL